MDRARRRASTAASVVAAALAGFRGVGKSHFLAAVWPILAKPELRAEISDRTCSVLPPRVSARRSYHIATVKRGSGAVPVGRLRIAAAAAIGAETAAVGSTVSEILHNCSVIGCGDSAFVIFFDTMIGRETRVARDDGSLLSEAAEIGKSMGMFVGVALDDDISGADGANSSISASYLIDYLDQEHLFKIVDTHIFAKDGSKLPLLRRHLCRMADGAAGVQVERTAFLVALPDASGALEVAPLIRLYIQDFALLGFAAEAGVKYWEAGELTDRARRDVRQRREQASASGGIERGICRLRPDRKRGGRQSTGGHQTLREANSQRAFPALA